jgi:hypothetical protein
VDIVSERDLSDGWLSEGGYEVVYLSASHLPESATQALESWVAAGGTLVSMVGAGLFNEYNQPQDTLMPVYGITDASLSAHTPTLYFNILPGAAVGGVVTLDENSPVGALATFEAVGHTLAMTVDATSDAVVLGSFADGSPAVLMNDYGAGRAFLFGGAPGMAYIRGGIGGGDTYTASVAGSKIAPYHPLRLEPSLRDLIQGPAALAGVLPEVHFSGLLIEGNLIESPESIVIPVANFNVRPQESITVTIRDLPAIASVESLAQGALSFVQQGDGTLVMENYGLALTDMLVLTLGEATECVPGPCEVSSVPEGAGCAVTFEAVGTGCDDGLLDTRDDQCDGAGTCAGTAYTCEAMACQESSVPNGADCTIEWSSARTGCDDGDACTTNTFCSSGGCVGEAVDCDDGNSCTLDSCLPSAGCVHDANAQEGQACGEAGFCEAGVCVAEPGGGTGAEPAGPEPSVAEDPRTEPGSAGEAGCGCRQGAPAPPRSPASGSALVLMLALVVWMRARRGFGAGQR